jgi:hypothetical protein
LLFGSGVEPQNDDSSVEVAAEASKVAPTDAANRPDVDAQAAQTASLAEPRMCLVILKSRVLVL